MLPFFIIQILLRNIMITTINFDYKFGFMAVKICYKIKNRMLSFESYI